MTLEILSPSGELLAEPPMALDDAVLRPPVIDGALGRRFMAMVIEHLSEPVLFLA